MHPFWIRGCACAAQCARECGLRPFQRARLPTVARLLDSSAKNAMRTHLVDKRVICCALVSNVENLRGLCVPTCCSFFLPKNGCGIVTKNGKNFQHCAHARADQRSAQHTRAQSTQLARTTERVRTNTNNMTHSAPHSAAQQNQAQEIISQRSATHHGAAHRNITEHTTPQCRATHDNTAHHTTLHHNTTQHNATH